MPKYTMLTFEIECFEMGCTIEDTGTHITATADGKAVMTIEKIKKDEVEIIVKFRSKNLKANGKSMRQITDGNTL